MNRRQFTDLLADVLHDASRLRTSFATLVVSIDDLARVNEAYGFAVGDEVISAVARRLRANLRGGDHLGRLAGNKFGLMLRNCTPHDLRLAGERLLVAVRDEVILTRTGPVAVTVSIGGIMAPRHAETVQELPDPRARSARRRKAAAARHARGLPPQCGTRGDAPREHARE